MLFAVLFHGTKHQSEWRSATQRRPCSAALRDKAGAAAIGPASSSSSSSSTACSSSPEELDSESLKASISADTAPRLTSAAWAVRVCYGHVAKTKWYGTDIA